MSAPHQDSALRLFCRRIGEAYSAPGRRDTEKVQAVPRSKLVKRYFRTRVATGGTEASFSQYPLGGRERLYASDHADWGPVKTRNEAY